LNELRRCLLPSIVVPLRSILQNDILKVLRDELEQNERLVLTPGHMGDAKGLRDAATTLLRIYDDIVDPYVRGSFEAAFGIQSQAISYYTILQNNEQAMFMKPTEAEAEVLITPEPMLDDPVVEETADNFTVPASDSLANAADETTPPESKPEEENIHSNEPRLDER
jgi:hypothetical protein